VGKAIVTVIEFRKVSYEVDSVDTEEEAKERYPYPGSVACEHSWEEAFIVDVELFTENEEQNDRKNSE